MKNIYKYQLDLDNSCEIEMPIGAKILTVQIQNDVICLWAIVDKNAKKIKRKFVILGTGFEFSDELNQYLGTVQMGSFVWHIFEEL